MDRNAGGGAARNSFEGAQASSFSSWWANKISLDPAGGFAADRNLAMALASYWWLIALRGVFALLFGIAALVVPGATLAALVLVFAVYMLVDGIFALVAGLGLTRRHQRSFALIFEGVVNLAVGVIALLWPLVTIVAFVLLMGCWAVVSGVLLCIGAFRLKLARGRWLLAAAGVISVIWGMLLLLWPLAGAIVLAWWMGGYALFFGGLLLITAFRLRALKQDSGLSETATAGVAGPDDRARGA